MSSRQKSCKNNQITFALASAAVHCETGNFIERQSLKHARIGRAESVLSTAYQCRQWGVSNHALFCLVRREEREQKKEARMKKPHTLKEKDQTKVLLEQARNSHENLMALSELLQGYVEAEWTRTDVLARTGKMMAQEGEKIYGIIQAVSKGC
jgi:hypothetical protein